MTTGTCRTCGAYHRHTRAIGGHGLFGLRPVPAL